LRVAVVVMAAAAVVAAVVVVVGVGVGGDPPLGRVVKPARLEPCHELLVVGLHEVPLACAAHVRGHVRDHKLPEVLCAAAQRHRLRRRERVRGQDDMNDYDDDEEEDDEEDDGDESDVDEPNTR
jgi:hypothetical protein